MVWTCKLLGIAELFQIHFFFMLLLQFYCLETLDTEKKKKKALN